MGVSLLAIPGCRVAPSWSQRSAKGSFVGFWWGPSSDCCRKDSGVQGLRILALKRLQTAVIESFARAAEGFWGFSVDSAGSLGFAALGFTGLSRSGVSGLCGDSSSRVYL